MNKRELYATQMIKASANCISSTVRIMEGEDKIIYMDEVKQKAKKILEFARWLENSDESVEERRARTSKPTGITLK